MGTKLLFLGLLIATSPQGQGHPAVIRWTPSQAEWKAGPNGSSLWVLEGDPKSSGMFTLRLRLGPGFALPWHTHPKEERVTVLEGTVGLEWDANSVSEKTATLGSGAFYVTPSGVPHRLRSDEGAVLQITGQGPWEVKLLSAHSK